MTLRMRYGWNRGTRGIPKPLEGILTHGAPEGTFWHRIQHFFGWNTGHVESFWIKGELWVGFKCHRCNTINGAHKARLRR